MGISI
ncbi:Protein of unknown function [Bacillus thuringiensis]